MPGESASLTHVIFGLSPLLVSLVIFVATYAIVISEKLNRAVIAALGAGLMILSGVLTQLAGVDGCTSESGSGGTCADGVALTEARAVAVTRNAKSAYVASDGTYRLSGLDAGDYRLQFDAVFFQSLAATFAATVRVVATS